MLYMSYINPDMAAGFVLARQVHEGGFCSFTPPQMTSGLPESGKLGGAPKQSQSENQLEHPCRKNFTFSWTNRMIQVNVLSQ